MTGLIILSRRGQLGSYPNLKHKITFLTLYAILGYWGLSARADGVKCVADIRFGWLVRPSGVRGSMPGKTNDKLCRLHGSYYLSQRWG